MCAGFVSMDGNSPSRLNVVLENCSNRYCLSFGTFSSVGSKGNFSGRRGRLLARVSTDETVVDMGYGNVSGRMFNPVHPLRLT